MSFQTKKLNNETVGEIPLKKPKDTRPVKGWKLFPEMNANIFMCARKKSGKSTVIFKSLQKCCGKNTKIIVFCATLHKDASWIAIKDWAVEHGLTFIGHESIKDDDGVDQLELLIKELQAKVEDEEAPKEKSCLDSDDEEEPKERKSKYQSPEYVFILDDLSNELQTKTIPRLLKVNRHFKSKTIISTQWWNDLHPMSRKQADYFILFRGHSAKKLEEIYRDANLSIPLEKFWQIYKFATKEPFSFLYVDCASGEFRRNFNELIEFD